MEDIKRTIQDKKTQIEKVRDEIKLQAHLGKKEARDEFEKLECEYEEFLKRLKPYTDEVGHTFDNTGKALGLAAGELRAGYERLSKMINNS